LRNECSTWNEHPSSQPSERPPGQGGRLFYTTARDLKVRSRTRFWVARCRIALSQARKNGWIARVRLNPFIPHATRKHAWVARTIQRLLYRKNSCRQSFRMGLACLFEKGFSSRPRRRKPVFVTKMDRLSKLAR